MHLCAGSMPQLQITCRGQEIFGLTMARHNWAAPQVDGEGGWEQGHRWDASKLCIDPYAPLIEGRRQFGVRDEVEQFRTKVSLFGSTALTANGTWATAACIALSWGVHHIGRLQSNAAAYELCCMWITLSVIHSDGAEFGSLKQAAQSVMHH